MAAVSYEKFSSNDTASKSIRFSPPYEQPEKRISRRPLSLFKGLRLVLCLQVSLAVAILIFGSGCAVYGKVTSEATGKAENQYYRHVS